MAPWHSKAGQADTFMQFLRFQEFMSEQGKGSARVGPKLKGKGKGKGAAESQNREQFTGIDLSRPVRRDEPLHAGRTATEVADIIARGGWAGKRQFLKYRGDVYTAIRKDGDLSCSRCKSATCRPWNEACWICGAAVPGGGKAGDQPRKKPPAKGTKGSSADDGTQDPAEDCDEFTLPKASAMASVKRRPPSTVATVLASASLKSPQTAQTYAEAAALTPPNGAHQPAHPASDGSPTPPPDPDLLSGAALGQVKALVAILPATDSTLPGLMERLEKHRAAEARAKRLAADAKQDTVDFTGKTYECILAHHESTVATLKKRAAEASAKRESDQEARRKELDRDRAVLQKAADMARRELDEFDELAALRTAEWEASEQARAADLQEQIHRAQEEVQRAKAALLAAPAPNTKLGHDSAAETTTGTGKGSGGVEVGVKGGGGNEMDTLVRNPPSPHQFSPMITPPKLHPPTDPTALGRLQWALAVFRQWSQQAEEWPLTPEMLGLTVLELSQLVGSDIWARSPLVSEQAAIPRSLRGSIQIALSGLEVTAAAEAAASDALRKSLEVHYAAAATAGTAAGRDEAAPPPGKHARTEATTAAGSGSDVDM